VGEAAGEDVVRCVLVFCAPTGAIEVTIEGPDLAAAVARARALTLSERDDPSPLPPAVPEPV